MNCIVWWEHVDSAANVADAGTRTGPDSKIYRALGISMKAGFFPKWPMTVNSKSLHDMLTWTSGLIDGAVTSSERWRMT
eukprot:10199374-Karenia_brevis.AAC.1